MLWKRRIWVAIALVLSLAVGIGAYQVVKPKQESKAQVLVIGSIKQPGVKDPTNPWMNLGGSLGVVANAVQVVVSDEQVATDLYEQGARATYTVEPNLTENAGPTLLVSADDVDPVVAQKTLIAVVNRIQTELVKLQTEQGVERDLFINTVVLTESPHPLPVRKAQVQKAIEAAIGVAALLIVLILIFERQRIVRARRRALRSTAGAGEDRSASAADSDDQAPRRPRRKRGRRRSGDSQDADEPDDDAATLDRFMIDDDSRPLPVGARATDQDSTNEPFSH